MPMPCSTRTPAKAQYEVSAPICVSSRNEVPMASRPNGTIRPMPVLSVRRPAIGMPSMAPRPCGASSRPMSIADSNRTLLR